MIDELMIDELMIDELMIDELMIDELMIDELIIDELMIDELINRGKHTMTLTVNSSLSWHIKDMLRRPDIQCVPYSSNCKAWRTMFLWLSPGVFATLGLPHG